MQRFIMFKFIFLLSFISISYANVTIFGDFHVSLDYIDNGSGDNGIQVSSNTSRLGIKGYEDLGGGLKALFQVNSRISISSQDDGKAGHNELSSHETYIGLSGKFGTLTLGHRNSPFKRIGRRYDLFLCQIGNTMTLLKNPDDTSPESGNINANGKGDFNDWDGMPTDIIMYQSPKFKNFHLEMAYRPDEVANGQDSNFVSLGLFYGIPNRSKFSFALGYERHGEAVTANGGTDFPEGFRAATNYKYKKFNFTLLYQMTTFDGIQDQVFGIGTTYSFGKNTFKLQYLYADNEKDHGDASMIAIGLNHHFTKKTFVYINYAFIDNESNQNYHGVSIGHGFTGIPAPDLGKDVSAFSLGMHLKF